MHCEALDRERTLKRWVTDYLGFVARVLRGAGTPAAEVDDAVQHTFIIAARRQADVRAGAERSFLLQTALNVAAHARRSAARRREAPASELPELVDASTPEQLTSLKHDRILLERVLQQLPPELRNVLVLSEVEELSRDEIAASLAIPAGTVASRLRRAREQLRERWRLERGVSAALGLSALLAAVRARAAAWGARLGRWAVPKMMAATAFVAAPVVVVGWRAASDAPTPVETASAAPEPFQALPLPPRPAEREVQPVVAREGAAARPAPSPLAAAAAKRPAAGAALQQELARLDAVRSRLGSGRAEQALALLDAYDREAPRGVLRLEAEVLRIDALSRTGRMAQARARAHAFLSRYPTSVLSARVRRLAGE
jgi:RNA polymerase sigma-70 factor, ECF subfamily